MQLLSEAGIKSIGDVADSDPLRMEHLLNRRSSNFGFKLVRQARSFPDLDLMISEVKHKRFDDCVESRIELAIDLKNSNKEDINMWTDEKQPRYIVCLTTSSEGEVSHLPLFLPLSQTTTKADFQNTSFSITGACREYMRCVQRTFLLILPLHPLTD